MIGFELSFEPYFILALLLKGDIADKNTKQNKIWESYRIAQ